MRFLETPSIVKVPETESSDRDPPIREFFKIDTPPKLVNDPPDVKLVDSVVFKIVSPPERDKQELIVVDGDVDKILTEPATFRIDNKLDCGSIVILDNLMSSITYYLTITFFFLV
jgi:hypothetical protein